MPHRAWHHFLCCACLPKGLNKSKQVEEKKADEVKPDDANEQGSNSDNSLDIKIGDDSCCVCVCSMPGTNASATAKMSMM